jgi:DNA polymerase-3 subunit epsilon
MYAIVDIETTGGNAKTDKITEIAIIQYDGKNIVNEFSTLVNPEREIPYHITALTGITNDMVATAPKFYEIAREIVDLTSDRIFVAHNAGFDYNFIRNEFRQLGYEYKRDQLCTVRLGRKIIPGHRSYSLGKLCDDLNIRIQNRHRAAGDALATARLFDYLLRLNNSAELFLRDDDILFRGLHPGFDRKQLDSIPEGTGIYYLLNENQEIIYIGKSNNLYKRIMTHLSNNSSRRAIQMKESIVYINIEITGSELIALLKESDEIKKFKPLFNRAQRWTTLNYGLYTFNDENGYICFNIQKIGNNTGLPLASFKNLQKAREELFRQVQTNHLCQKISGLYDAAGACFYYALNDCNGACLQKESPEKYNIRAKRVISSFSYNQHNFYIVDKGRNNEEKTVVKIENGRYVGFGYFPLSETLYNPSELDEYITVSNDNQDIQRIIFSFLRRNRVEKVISF